MTNTAASDEANGVISGTLLFFGIALTIFGVLAIIFSFFVTIGIVVCIGGLLVAAAIVQFIHIFKTWRGDKKVLLHILSGLVYLITGGLLLYNPLSGALSLTLLLSAFFIVAGIIRCFYAIAHRKERSWGWFLFGGIINIILGAIIYSGWPITGLWLIGLFVGIEMLLHGISWIAMSAALKQIKQAAFSRT